jgi:hypothetical protein
MLLSTTDKDKKMKIETLRQLIALMKKRRAFYDSLPDSVGEAFMDNQASSAMETAVDLLVKELCVTQCQVDYCEWLMFDFVDDGDALYIDGVKHELNTTDEAIDFLLTSGLWEASRPCHR